MAVVLPTRNDVPVKVRYDIAKAGQVDLVRAVACPDGRFGGKYHTHQPHLVSGRKVCHFTGVLAKNHPAKTRVVSIRNAYDAAKLVFPERFTAR